MTKKCVLIDDIYVLVGDGANYDDEDGW